MKTVKKYKNRKELSKAKRRNANLFSVYKMFSWDLLFFYAIQYLFFTITKGISPGDLLKVSAFYPLFIILMQMPAAICGDFLGRKKSIVIGNLVISLYILILIFVPDIMSIFIANIIYAFGYSLKSIQETNILYDSTATKGGEGLYPKINAKGASGYYILDGIASMIAGYLFVINGYLPLFICLIFTLISAILATGFKDIYVNKLEEHQISKRLKAYKKDFKYSIKNIIKSKRLRALLIFMALFNASLSIMSTYKGNILTELDVKPETFSIINATLTFIAGMAGTMQDKLHKKFKNKTLAVLSLALTTSIILIGALLYTRAEHILPIILILLAVKSIARSNYYILAERYSKNFSTPKSRMRISFATELFTNTVEGTFLFLAGALLDATNIRFATLFMGLLLFMLFVLALDYMRTRIGLKPKQYHAQDIELD